METKTQYIAIIEQDDCPEDPLEYDEAFTLVNMRLPNYTNYVDGDRANEILAEAHKNGDRVFEVSFTDHSGFWLNIGGPIDRWDSGRFGFLVVHNSALCLKEEVYKEQALKIAEDAIERWNTYSMGGVLAVRIVEQTICPCCNQVTTEETVEICGGFLSEADAQEFIKDLGYDIKEVQSTC